MAHALRILMLLTDGFGGVGGIAKFNRDFLEALNGCRSVERVHALPRLIPNPVEELVPEAVVYDRKAAGEKMAFMRRVGTRAWGSAPADLVICGHLYLLSAAWLLARLRGARLALIIHGIEAWKPSPKMMVNQLARKVDTFISVSHHSAERFSGWCNIRQDRAFILPNCVDLDAFVPRERDAALVERYGFQTSKVIMTTGRLASEERYKGFDEVIELMPALLERFPTLKYLIVGDGPDRPRLTAKVRDLGLSGNVVFAGYIPEAEKVAHYSLADAYVMPSQGEGFGIVLIEAAACGVPVVGSRLDGSSEALLNGRLGQLVDPRHPNELLKAVVSILENAPTRRRIDAIHTFSKDNFRSLVADWCRAQVAGGNAGLLH